MLISPPDVRTYRDWFGHIGGRLVTIPDAATPLQRAQLLAALSVGSEIIQLRDRARRLGLNADLDPVIDEAIGESAQLPRARRTFCISGPVADCAASEHGGVVRALRRQTWRLEIVRRPLPRDVPALLPRPRLRPDMRQQSGSS
jgi:hypothetical protein